MNLYYYSFQQKKFLQLSSRLVIFYLSSLIITKKKITGRLLGFFVITLLLTPGVSYASGLGDFFSAAGDIIGGGLSSLLFTILEPLAKFMFWVAGLFVVVMGKLLDMGIAMTISSSLYQNLQVINVGWTTVRDFSNMFFIFALLYIAIKTILGLAGSSTKKWVTNLIIAAILINFSLFATKVVIDAGNVLAMGFWEKMTIVGKPDPSAAENLMQGLKLQTGFDLKDKDGKPTDSSAQTRTLTYLGGALVMLIAGFVFLAGAIMMIVRTVTLILLMIASPFAFLSFALPVGGGYANKWLSKLIGNAFVAPAFLAMLYLDIIIINGLDLQKLTNSNGTKFGGVFSGDVGSFPIIYNFLVVIILLLASLTVASSVSSGAGEQGGRLAKRYLGYGAGAVFAGGAAGGRQTFGRFGKSRMDNKDWVAEQNRLVTKGNFLQRNMANAKLATYGGMKKATFDGRNSSTIGKALGAGGVSAGAGTKRSYETSGSVGSSMRSLDKITGGYRGTDKEKQLIDTAKARYASDPAAQKMYLGDRGVDLEAKRNKDVAKELNRGVKTQDHKAAVTDAFEAHKNAEKDLAGGKITQDAFKAVSDQLSETLKKSLGELTALEKTEFLKEEQLRMPQVIKVLNSQDLAALNAKGELSKETRDAINSGVVKEGTNSARAYIKNQTKQATGQFQYDAPANLAALTTDYNTQKEKLRLGQVDAAAFDTYATKQKKEIGEALGMVGNAEEISHLSNDLIVHEAVVSNYNAKVIGELRTKLKTSDAALAADFENKVQIHNTAAQTQTAAAQQNARAAAAARSAPQSRVIPPTPPTGTV